MGCSGMTMLHGIMGVLGVKGMRMCEDVRERRDNRMWAMWVMWVYYCMWVNIVDTKDCGGWCAGQAGTWGYPMCMVGPPNAAPPGMAAGGIHGCGPAGPLSHPPLLPACAILLLG
jgi:hypothetical protein